MTGCNITSSLLTWEAWGCLGQISGYMFFMNSIRYFPLAGLFLLILWVWRKEAWLPWRIQERFPKAERIWYEFGHSFATLVIFVLIGTMSLGLSRAGLTAMYFDPGAYGYWYLPASFALITMWHETYFYWMHRLVHRRPWFRLVHLNHHKSTNPSPMAAYSFHPYEAFLEGIYLFLFVLVVPMHPIVLILHTFYAMILNILWHGGYEFFPKGWTRGTFTKWINTSTHHNMHHSHVNCNYSLYFNFWDRVMGTNHPRYDEYFDAVVERRERGKTMHLGDAGDSGVAVT